MDCLSDGGGGGGSGGSGSFTLFDVRCPRFNARTNEWRSFNARKKRANGSFTYIFSILICRVL